MLRALRDNERRSMIYLSLMLCCGSLALLPLTAQSSLEPVAAANAGGATAMPDAPEKLRFPDIAVARDPFVPERTEDPIAAPSPGTEAGATGATVVRAVVVGQESRALVEVNGIVRVLSVGDLLGSSRIAAVDSNGVVLDNGARITISDRQPR